MSLGSMSGGAKTPMSETFNTFNAFLHTTHRQLIIECTFVDKDGRHRMKGAKPDEIDIVIDFSTAEAIPGLAVLASQASEAIERDIRSQREQRRHREREAAVPTSLTPRGKGKGKGQVPVTFPRPPAIPADAPTKGGKRKSSAKD